MVRRLAQEGGEDGGGQKNRRTLALNCLIRSEPWWIWVRLALGSLK
jgi:hypothetical protein